MLRKIRVIAAVLIFTAAVVIFLDFTGVIHAYLGWVAKIQLIPAILAMNFIVVGALILMTLIFGRVYCSVVCPLGITQDIISHVSGMRKGHKFRFRYRKGYPAVRYTLLALFIAALIAGIPAIFTLIEPYSAFGRIAGGLFSPLYEWGNNLIASICAHFDSYAFYHHEVIFKGAIVIVTAIVTLSLIIFLSWKYGRFWCNTVCPVGTLLGALSRVSLFRISIDESKCVGCKACGRKCKGECMDTEHHKIDYSRCIVCFDCIDNCKEGAVSYRFAYGKKGVKPQDRIQERGREGEKSDKGRRAFMTTALTLATATVLDARRRRRRGDGGLAVIEEKVVPKRNTPIVPPGAISLKHLNDHCTSCQLCITNCPNNVLRPSTDITRLMQPEAFYEKGFCRPECTRCSELCPNGAIKPITTAEKTSISIGHAVWICDNCIVSTDGVSCGNCARHCPTGAIKMVDSGNGKKIPSINTAKCIGCGACEYHCPARPLTAIYVEGNETHIID